MTRDQLIEELRKMPYNDEVVLQFDVEVRDRDLVRIITRKNPCCNVVPQANTIVLTP